MDLQFATREYLKVAISGSVKEFQTKPFLAFLYSVDPISITDLCVYVNVSMEEDLLSTLKKDVKRNKIDCKNLKTLLPIIFERQQKDPQDSN